MKNFGDYVYFIYMGNNKSHAFRNYKDSITGREVGYVTGYDKNNQPIYEPWIFNFDSRRIVRVHKEEKDLTGRSAVDFLRNSPECAGSPNGIYMGEKGEIQVGVYFKEVNEAKDAKNAVASRTKSIEAQSKALSLKDQDLIDMAAIIGVYDFKNPQDPEILTHRMLDFAFNFPDKFLSYLNDPARKILSLVRRAISAGVFSTQGKMIKWEEQLIGADESEAVTNLLKDEKLRKSIELHLSKVN